MIPVPETLQEVVVKLVEVITYLENEDKRRSRWEAEVNESIADFEDRITDIELKVSNLEADE